jgi:hypothetical protein
VFFGSILWCTQSGDHPQEDLAISGYNINMKENFCKICFCIFWLLTLTIYRNRAIFIKFWSNYYGYWKSKKVLAL